MKRSKLSVPCLLGILGFWGCGTTEADSSGANNEGENNVPAEATLAIQLDGRALTYKNVTSACTINEAGVGANLAAFVDPTEPFFARVSIVGGNPVDLDSLLTPDDLQESTVLLGGQVQYQALGSNARLFFGGDSDSCSLTKSFHSTNTHTIQFLCANVEYKTTEGGTNETVDTGVITSLSGAFECEIEATPSS